MAVRLSAEEKLAILALGKYRGMTAHELALFLAGKEPRAICVELEGHIEIVSERRGPGKLLRKMIKKGLAYAEWDASIGLPRYYHC